MKKRISALAAAFIMLGGCLPRMNVSAKTDVYSGKCGDDITWEYDEDTGTLTLTGTGRMYENNRNYMDELLGYSSYRRDQWQWSDFIEDVEHIEIGEGIENIGSNAFSNAKRVKELTIPDSVTEIGASAFAFNTQMETVHFSKNLRTIQERAFSYASSITEITLPDGLEYIGAHCFNNTCAVREMEIPDSVTYIGLEGLTNSAKWHQKQREKSDFLIVGDGILYQCYFPDGKDTETLTVPDGVKVLCGSALRISGIENYGFGTILELDRNNYLQEIILPDSVEHIDDQAFRYMSSLENVRLSANLTEIGDNLFEGCTALKSCSIPDSVTRIGKEAFSSCSALADIDIPASVTSIGQNAFAGTEWLSGQKGFLIYGGGCLYRYNGQDRIIDIPENVRSITGNALSGNRIAAVRIPATVERLDAEAINCKYAEIVGEKGSAAEQYAKENDIPFRDASAVQIGRDLTLDFSKDTWSFSNSSKVFNNGVYLTDTDRQLLVENGLEEKTEAEGWNGSCVGMSISVILAKNGLFSPAELQAGAASLSELTPTDAVQSFINYYQCTQCSKDKSSKYEPEEVKLYRMIQTAENVKNGASPFLLTFSTKNASHGVVGFGQESGEWTFDDRTYDSRILVWDPNALEALRDASCVYYDSHTLDYCIPQYSVHVAEGADDNTAGIITVCNDLSILNAFPHPLAQHKAAVYGDVNDDGGLTIADAVLLTRVCAEDPTVQSANLEDLDGDGYLNVTDVLIILKMLQNAE